MEQNAFTLTPPNRMPTLILDRTLTTDLTTDYTLPDYLPEIKRLLRVTPTVLPEQRYLGAGSAEFGGRCSYCITYAGADGCLWSATVEQEYSVTTPLDPDQLARGLDPQADAQLEQLVSRVAGPRKLSLRARLRTHLRAYGEESIEPVLEGDPAPASIERLSKPACAMRVVRGAAEPLDLGDEIALGAAGDETRIIRADGCVTIGTVSAETGEIACRGELMLRLLCENGELETFERRIPFEARVAMPDATPQMHPRARGRCGDIDTRLEEGRILCDATVWIEVEGAEPVDLTLTADCFATDGDLIDEAYREIEVCTLAKCGNLPIPISGSIAPTDAGLDANHAVIDVTATAQIEAIDAVGGRCTLRGSCRMSLIGCAEEEFASGEVSLPFVHTIDCGEVCPSEFAALPVPVVLRVRADGAGEGRSLHIEGEATMPVRLFAREKRRVLARAVYRPSGGETQTGYTVCYPEAEESLWSVCRRYHARCAAVAAANRLDGDAPSDSPASLAGVEHLLI